MQHEWLGENLWCVYEMKCSINWFHLYVSIVGMAMKMLEGNENII